MDERLVTVGFDPGLATTGYGVVRATAAGWEVVAGGVIETDKETPRPQRLREIFDEARALIEAHSPTAVSIEEVYLATNAKTAMRTAETRGVLLMAASGLPVREYTPLQVKKRIAGYGRASKAQVQAMVKRLLRLSETPKPDDVADGLAVALCCLLDLRGRERAGDVRL
jgi:crossover junction endodeoxyribonuclease RuvC